MPKVGACAGERPDGLTAGVNLRALSLPGGMLTVPLCAVPPTMTLLEALQTRQAQDMLSALEAARAPLRHPLDISLQVQMHACNLASESPSYAVISTLLAWVGGGETPPPTQANRVEIAALEAALAPSQGHFSPGVSKLARQQQRACS